MRQTTQRHAERRSQTQPTGTFTFWFRRPQAPGPIGAWMLDQSGEEASFLTSAGDAPRLGEELELTGPCDAALGGLTDRRGPNPHLPRFGRVVRLDDPQGTTRRVAIRFEDQLQPARV